jgi:hypothetical protein
MRSCICTAQIKERVGNDALAPIVVYIPDVGRTRWMGPEEAGDRPGIFDVKEVNPDNMRYTHLSAFLLNVRIVRSADRCFWVIKSSYLVTYQVECHQWPVTQVS